MEAPEPGRLIVAITGASGAIYGIRALLHLSRLAYVETHLVVTAAARRTIAQETDWGLAAIVALADHCHHPADLGAAIASGSFRTRGMLVAPCSVKTLSAIAHCADGDLVARAADVCLKERRRVVLMLAEALGTTLALSRQPGFNVFIPCCQRDGVALAPAWPHPTC